MLTPQARTALAQAAEKQHPITDLEYLKYPQRNINMLEGAGITTMDQLLSCQPGDLMGIANFGTKAMSQLMRCLGEYHKIEGIKNSFDNDLHIRRHESRHQHHQDIFPQ